MDRAAENLDSPTKRNIDSWLQGDYDEETKTTIRRLLEENPQELIDAFYTNLSFGTGGLRGIMGIGTNRINPYTVRAATQGLANYINKQPTKERKHRVFIGYDSRHHSRHFAEEAAKVLAGNGIQVYLTEKLRPTPLVSFGCRYYKCTAAIMITASHNPPEYNGYKVYWEDGAQVLPPHDKAIIDEVNNISKVSQVKTTESLTSPLIQEVGSEVDKAYLNAITSLQNYPTENQAYGSSLKVVYTSLHGTGITLAPQALELWGFPHITLVDPQVIPDGDFPTAASPNPEERKALTLGIETLETTESDILIATDPDADRVGIAIRHENSTELLNGNQVACLCLAHICEALTKQNRLPDNTAFVKTIGTSELFQAIADSYKKPCFNVLTGFKYIAEKIRQWEQEPSGYQYVFGGEESYGYLLGTHVRDKDAIICTALICEMALHAKRQGKTLIDKLHELYRKYGVYVEKLLSITFPETKMGKEQMVQGMVNIRQNPPQTLLGKKITSLEDYQNSTKTDLMTGKVTPITLPKSNVLLFWLEDRSKVMVRPSGTEPKIKLYCGVTKKVCGSIPETIADCEQYADKLLHTLKNLLSG